MNLTKMMGIAAACCLSAWPSAGAANAPRYEITGRVFQIPAGRHATVHAHGPTHRSTSTRSDGTWQIERVTPGVYSVTVTLSGYRFAPVERKVDVSKQNAHNINFTAHPASTGSGGAGSGGASGGAASGRHSITGAISNLEPGQQIYLELTGPQDIGHYTHADGTFEFRLLKPGTYRVKPVSKHYRFIPTYRTVNITKGDHTGVTFQAVRLKR
jgi:hypothetical protein